MHLTQLLVAVILSFFVSSNVLAKENQMKEEAIFAMGCFWCGESEFRNSNGKPISGVLSLRVGYAGGTIENPTYHNHEGYKEAVKIVFDSAVISYSELLDIFWHNVDIFDKEGQFCDKGFPYTSVIFYTNDAQKALAQQRKEKLGSEFGAAIATEILPFTTFYDAEEYHQDYKHKNPVRYRYYRWNCGRDQRLKEIWKR